MERVINLGIPHVGELIFESIETPGLFQFALVSETWKVLAENVLVKRWKGRMFEACKSGETKIVQLLLEHCATKEIGLKTKDEDGWTALIWACYNGHKDVVKLLLDHSERIELNAKTTWEETAFMRACSYGHTDVVKLLLDHSNPKIELNARDKSGWTAFMKACSYVRIDVVKLLLNHSDKLIRLDVRDPNGKVSIGWATIRGSKYNDIVELILKRNNEFDQ